MPGTPLLPPSILVVFGATGDLFKKKIVPSIRLLKEEGRLPERFKIIGFGRQPLSDDEFRARVANALANYPEKEDIAALFSYVEGTFEDAAAFARLKDAIDTTDAAWGLCSAKAFYLAVPPELFENLFKKIHTAKLNEECDSGGLRPRILIEKPFGGNLAEAKALTASVRQYFDEADIYRVEHYLAKDALRALTRLRHEEPLRTLLSPARVARVHARLFETLGIEDRGAFYDKVGAWRDVGENHLVMMLALAFMELPANEAPAAVREARARFIASLPVLTDSDIESGTVRGQHEGYRHIAGVAKDSATETYFKVPFSFAGIDATLEGGKRLPEAHKGLELLLRPAEDGATRILIELEPKNRIAIEYADGRIEELWTGEAVPAVRYAAQYADLIAAALRGETEQFVCAEEVEAEWRFADPITSAFARNVVPLKTYSPDKEIPA